MTASNRPLLLPPPCDPLAGAGNLLPGPAARLGVTAGTPVIAGTLDSYADVAGTGAAPGYGLPPARLDADRLCRLARARAGARASRCSTSPRPVCSSGGSSVCGGATLDWLGELLGQAAGDLHELQPGAGGLLALPLPRGRTHAHQRPVRERRRPRPDLLGDARRAVPGVRRRGGAERAGPRRPATCRRHRSRALARRRRRDPQHGAAARVLRRARPAARRDAARRRRHRACGARVCALPERTGTRARSEPSSPTPRGRLASPCCWAPTATPTHDSGRACVDSRKISPSKGEARPLGGLHGDDVNIDAAQHPFWDVMWTFFLIWIWVSWIWLVIVVIGDIIRRRDISAGAKAAWGSSSSSCPWSERSST